MSTTLTTTASSSGAWSRSWPAGLTAGVSYQAAITQTVGGVASAPRIMTRTFTADEISWIDAAWAATAAYGLTAAAQLARVAAILPAMGLVAPFGGMAGIAAVYGVRRLVDGYCGPLIRVARSSDGGELDIWWDETGWLDVAALLAFAAGGSVYVVCWYDQSGLGRHAVQATPAARPRIVAAGVVDVAPSGRPWLVFSGSQSLSTSTLPAYGDTDSTLVCLFRAGTNPSNGRALCHGDSSAPRSLGVSGGGTAVRLWAGNIVLGSAATLASTMGTYGNGTATLYANGSAATTEVVYATAAGHLHIGYDPAYNGYINGNIAEAMMLSRKLTAAEVASIRAEHATSWGSA